MATEYRLSPNGRVTKSKAEFDRKHGRDVIWIDVVGPSDAELARLDKLLGFEVPNRHDIAEIELSSRLYREDDGSLVMVANLLPHEGSASDNPQPAAFILRRNMLLTIRYYEFYSFDRTIQAVTRSSDVHTPIAIFSRLLEEAVADRADNLELSMRYMEELTARLFRPPSSPKAKTETDAVQLDLALRQIGRMGKTVSNIRESITSLQRVVNFAYTYIPTDWLGEQKIVLQAIRTDLTALSDEASFFMNKLSFNLDAVLGMINIDESKIIRLLSVVTLLLSPPTLIAGIYGMNFDIMPELHWTWGYAFSFGLMGLTAFASIWYLKRKRWM